jgi:predicted secreted protein
MKKIHSTVFAFLILLAMCADSPAGDYANLNVIGFSKDGKFLAYEEYGSFDGSGFPYSNIYFINVEKNAYAAAPVSVTIEKETATENAARSKAKIAAAKKLRELKIVSGNKGKLVASHLITDLTYDAESKDGTDKVRFAEILISMYRRGDYELTLKPILTKTKDCEAYGYDIFKLELSLKNNEAETTRFLQKDAELPKSRGCVIEYRIQDVYLYEKALDENNIAIFINVFTPGFEGPDMRYMVVSGKLN